MAGAHQESRPHTTGRRPGVARAAVAGAGLVGIAAATAVVVGLTGGGGPAPGGSRPAHSAGIVSLGRTAPVSLSTFTSCDSLRTWFVDHALPGVTAYGVTGLGGVGYATGAIPPGAVAMAGAGAASAAAAAPNALSQDSATRAGAAQEAGTSATGATSPTGTNVQVAGVDEADVAKRVGDLLVTVADNGSAPGLRVLRTSGQKAVVVGLLATGDWTPSSVLVDGDTALLIGAAPQVQPDRTSSSAPPGQRFMMTVYRQRTRIEQVDLTNPAAPTVVRTLDVDGSSAGARLVDGVVRIAVDSNVVALPFVGPALQPTADGQAPDQSTIAKAEAAALAANKEVLAKSTVEDWLPSFSLSSPGGATTTGSLVDCADVTAPTRFAGFDTLALLTFDLRDGGVSTWRSAGVVASGTTMYATADRTYLATTQWQAFRGVTPMAAAGPATDAGASAASGTSAPAALASEQTTTQVHVFDTSGRGAVSYLGGGEVPGTLLDQFSMDEYRGDLRIATTTQPIVSGGPILAQPGPGPAAAGAADDPATSGTGTAGTATADGTTTTSPATGATTRRVLPTASRSQVTVLRLTDGRLTAVGTVTGLGVGEQIRSVRFIGPVGYVVTFRQTDPLYTVDLSNPAAPKVAGELKLLGFSAYLHPAGDGLLLGVGQAANASGRTTGLQLSLFDVSDPASPKQISRVALPALFSDATSDHHAFTFADGLVLLPVQGNGLATPVAVGAPPVAVADSGGVVTELGAAPPSGTVTASEAGSGPAATPGSSGSGSTGSGSTGSGVAAPVTVDTGVLAVRLDGRRFTGTTLLRMQPPAGTGITGPDAAYLQPLRTYVDHATIWTVTTVGLGIHDEATLRRLGFVAFG